MGATAVLLGWNPERGGGPYCCEWVMEGWGENGGVGKGRGASRLLNEKGKEGRWQVGSRLEICAAIWTVKVPGEVWTSLL